MDFHGVPGSHVYKDRASPLDSRIDFVRFTFVTAALPGFFLKSPRKGRAYLKPDGPTSVLNHPTRRPVTVVPSDIIAGRTGRRQGRPSRAYSRRTECRPSSTVIGRLLYIFTRASFVQQGLIFGATESDMVWMEQMLTDLASRSE
jgi:hypothetical protein